MKRYLKFTDVEIGVSEVMLWNNCVILGDNSGITPNRLSEFMLVGSDHDGLEANIYDLIVLRPEIENLLSSVEWHSLLSFVFPDHIVTIYNVAEGWVKVVADVSKIRVIENLTIGQLTDWWCTTSDVNGLSTEEYRYIIAHCLPSFNVEIDSIDKVITDKDLVSLINYLEAGIITIEEESEQYERPSVCDVELVTLLNRQTDPFKTEVIKTMLKEKPITIGRFIEWYESEERHIHRDKLIGVFDVGQTSEEIHAMVMTPGELSNMLTVIDQRSILAWHFDVIDNFISFNTNEQEYTEEYARKFISRLSLSVRGYCEWFKEEYGRETMIHPLGMWVKVGTFDDHMLSYSRLLTLLGSIVERTSIIEWVKDTTDVMYIETMSTTLSTKCITNNSLLWSLDGHPLKPFSQYNLSELPVLNNDDTRDVVDNVDSFLKRLHITTYGFAEWYIFSLIGKTDIDRYVYDYVMGLFDNSKGISRVLTTSMIKRITTSAGILSLVDWVKYRKFDGVYTYKSNVGESTMRGVGNNYLLWTLKDE